MELGVTFLTNRNNIKPMLRIIRPVMIFYGLFSALAIYFRRVRQNSLFYGLSNSAVGLVFFLVVVIVFQADFSALFTCFVSASAFSGFIIMVITILCFSAFFALLVFFSLFVMASFTVSRIPIFIRRIEMKFRYVFDCIALTAYFLGYIKRAAKFVQGICPFFVLFTALFTNSGKFIRTCFVPVKFRNWLFRFAFRASFCYDFVSHNQLPNSWLRLEPYASDILTYGSLILSEMREQVKRNIILEQKYYRWVANPGVWK